LTRESGPGGLLELMAVDGLIVADRFAMHRAALEANGWSAAAVVADGVVYHRTGPSSPRVRAVTEAEFVPDANRILERLRQRNSGPIPLLLLDSDDRARTGKVAFGPAHMAIPQESRTTISVDVTAVSPERSALIVFSRPWYPGYRATFNGQPVSFQLANLTMLAVELPPGATGRLTLEYAPSSFVMGTRVALAMLAVLCLLGVSLVIGHWAMVVGRSHRSALWRMLSRPVEHLHIQLSKSFLISCLGAILDFGLLVMLVELAGIHPLSAAVVAYTIPCIVGYFLSCIWVFPTAPPNHVVGLCWFLLLSLGGLTITWITMAIGYDGLGVSYPLTKIVALGLAFGWNFLSRKYWVFGGATA
jgi:putative flippase GtrA